MINFDFLKYIECMKALIRRVWFGLLLISSVTARAAEHITLSLLNTSSTTNTLEYDVYIVNDGTTNMKLAGVQFGINFNVSILNGGSPTSSAYTYIAGSRDPIFSTLTAFSVAYNNAQLKVTSTPATLLNSVNLPIGVSYKLGRFRFTNTVSWTAGSMPQLAFQETVLAGKTHAVAVAYVGTNTSSSALSLATSNLATNTVTGLILNSTLPVSLLHFFGHKNQNTDDLYWTTTQEMNNKQFLLEYSRDGIHFDPCKEVPSLAASGYSNQVLQYHVVNEKVAEGHNYYRIRQEDIDGTFYYPSSIIDINRSVGPLPSLFVFPNPCRHQVNIRFMAQASGRYRLQMMAINGCMVQDDVIDAQEGLNDYRMLTQNLQDGMYTIAITDDAGYRQSICVQHRAN
jgi:hypothetical protein